MTIELLTETQTNAAEMQTIVDRLDARREQFNAAALAGTLSPTAVAEIEGERTYARMRSEAAAAAAASERNQLASPEQIAAAISELEADESLSVTNLTEALLALTEAISAFEAASATRNENIANWVRKLRALGIPNTGLNIDGKPVTLKGGGTIGNLRNGREVGSIAIGNSRVSVLVDAGSYIAGAVDQSIRDARQKLNPSSLTLLDQRHRSSDTALAITITQDVGDFKTGDRVTSHTHSRGALQHLVNSGYATDDNAPFEPEAPVTIDQVNDDQGQVQSAETKPSTRRASRTPKHPGDESKTN